MKHSLLTLWQLPQILIGKFLLLIYKKDIETTEELKDITYYFIKGFRGGISLGTIILVNARYIYGYNNTLKHEYGHTIQSKKLGWLYLLVIGIPSAIWAALYGPIIKREGNKYYTFYTEKWADKLGEVIRE